ncbi:MAG: hypothetical protein F4Y01_16060 [Gammaproteobacteria bacterium]|nr:hypothetical protein [Gammaproteobacteria bacterium]
MRRAAWTVLISVGALIGIVWVGLLRGEFWLEEAIEDAGTKRLGVPVEVSAVDFELADRRVEVLGIEVSNPPGIEGPPALAVGRLAVTLQLGRTGDEALVVELLELDDVVVTAVVDGYSEGAFTNIGRIVERSRRGAAAQRSKEAAGADPGLRVIVERMSVRGGRGALVSPLGSTEAELPDIRIEGIGGSEGVSVDELTAEVVARLADQTNEAVAREMIDRIDVENVVERVKGKLDRFVDRLAGKDEGEDS